MPAIAQWFAENPPKRYRHLAKRWSEPLDGHMSELSVICGRLRCRQR
jgi:hypothetical protein